MTHAPTWSVVIPTYDRPARVRDAVAATAACAPPAGGFEIIVVDDGGRADLSGLAELGRADVPVTLVRQRNAGPAAARNRGARAARGAMLAFTDDDCVPAPGWLRAFAAAAERDDGGGSLFGGRTVNELAENRFSAASQDLIDYLDHAGNADPNDGEFFASNNIAIAARAFAAVGGFDVDFPLAAGEDRDFCARLRTAGRRLRSVPAAVVGHRHALDARRFWRQHENYGRGAYRFRDGESRRRDGEGVAQATTPKAGGQFRRPAYYAKLVGFPLRRGLTVDAFARSGLLAVAQAATVSGYLREWTAARRGVMVDAGNTETGRGGAKT